jgi:hypothetical protein
MVTKIIDMNIHGLGTDQWSAGDNTSQAQGIPDMCVGYF